MTSQSITRQDQSLYKRLSGLNLHRGTLFALIILTALVAFEIFNFSTTAYALTDMLGNLKFAGIGWSVILAIAFCGIDFAGIARLFTPDSHSKEISESWYLFGAWILAATMNAILTWWAVSLALESHTLQGTSEITPDTLMLVVPIFVAIMVWIIRILIIGSLSMASDRLFGTSRIPHSSGNLSAQRNYSSQPTPYRVANANPISSSPANASMQSAHKAPVTYATPAARQPVAVHMNDSKENSAGLDRPVVTSAPSRPEPVYQPLNSSSHSTGITRVM